MPWLPRRSTSQPPPPQGYPPQPGYGHYPQHGRPKGKGKLIAIIVVVAALAAGGIVLAVVLSKRNSGGGGGGGFDSGEALVKATLEALVAGDGDKLLSFTPPTDVALAALDCPAEAKAENEKQIKQSVEETKKKLAEAASKMKGSGAQRKAKAEKSKQADEYVQGECSQGPGASHR